METLAPGDIVLFDNGPGYVGTVAGRIGSGWKVTFHPGSDGAWLCVSPLTKLPADTPIFRTGTAVQVRCDAPHFAGCRGRTCGAELKGEIFGYWLDLGDGNRAWAPAAALFAVEGGVARRPPAPSPAPT